MGNDAIQPALNGRHIARLHPEISVRVVDSFDSLRPAADCVVSVSVTVLSARLMCFPFKLCS